MSCRVHVPRILAVMSAAYNAGLEQIRGICRYARLYGPWNIHLVQGGWGDSMPTTLKGLKEYDGILIGARLEYAKSLAHIGRPIVLVDPVDNILSDNRFLASLPRTHNHAAQVGQLAAKHLLATKRKSFGYVGMTIPLDWSVRRGQAFMTALAQSGYTCSIFRTPMKMDTTETPYETDYHALLNFLRTIKKPAAIFAASDPRARQVANACYTLGLNVPSDVAILGVDNDPLLCESGYPSLSSIQLDQERNGFEAARMLAEMLDGGDLKGKVHVYGTLGVTVRASTDLLNQGHWSGLALRVREAIRANARSPLTIAQIIEPLHISRRTAETTFAAAAGHSILTELHEIRLQMVEELLKESTLSLGEIAAKCGFSTETNLRALFKRKHGVDMRAWRKSQIALRNPCGFSAQNNP